MTQRRTPRWRRRVERQRAEARRVIGAGAVVSLVLGVGAELVVIDHTPSDVVGLVRLALLLPSVIFLAWWALVPGYSATVRSGGPDVTDAPVTTVVERMNAIESTFDAAAVPAARRGEGDVSPATGDELRRSVRVSNRKRPGDVQDSYGLGGR